VQYLIDIALTLLIEQGKMPFKMLTDEQSAAFVMAPEGESS